MIKEKAKFCFDMDYEFVVEGYNLGLTSPWGFAVPYLSKEEIARVNEYVINEDASEQQVTEEYLLRNKSFIEDGVEYFELPNDFAFVIAD